MANQSHPYIFLIHKSNGQLLLLHGAKEVCLHDLIQFSTSNNLSNSCCMSCSNKESKTLHIHYLYMYPKYKLV